MISILVIAGGYVIFKPNLPEINLVDEGALQIPLKVFTADGILIGEFGDQKRRTIFFEAIPALIAFNNSPAETTSAPDPIFFNSLSKETFELDLTEKLIDYIWKQIWMRLLI